MKLKENLFNVYIFTPTYNRKDNLRKLLHSLEKQTCKEFTWIIVDDGSTDGTESFIKDKTLEKN